MRRPPLSTGISAAILGVLFLAPPLVATSHASDPTNGSRECPVVFQDLPSRIDPSDVQRVRLVASDGSTETVRILKPSKYGFLVIKNTSRFGEPVDGIYQSDSVHTTEYRLAYGLGAVEWGTVAKRVNELEWEIMPGTYRLVLRYLAAGQEQIASIQGSDAISEVLICLSVSSPFELTQSFSFLTSKRGTDDHDYLHAEFYNPKVGRLLSARDART